MSEHFTFQPRGVCSSRMDFELSGDTIESLKVTGGCNGNLKGIASLLQGMKIDDVIERLDGVQCGMKGTSCPDQIARALKRYRSL